MGFAILLPILFAVLELSFANQLFEPCPLVGPDLFGDFRYHDGCRLVDHASSEFAEMESLKVPDWLEELSNQLLNSTHLVNNYNQNGEHCGDSCIFTRSTSPECCQVDTRLLYPMYGRSITSGRHVRIVQEPHPRAIIQPVVYRHCRSENTSLVKGRCRQGVLPRLVYVASDTPSGYPYRQDLIMMPNNCDCLVSLAADASDPRPTTIVPARERSAVASSIESSGEGPTIGLQHLELFP